MSVLEPTMTICIQKYEFEQKIQLSQSMTETGCLYIFFYVESELITVV